MTQIKTIDTLIEDKIKHELEISFDSKRKRIFSKIFSAALGSIPWVGGFLSAMADFKSDEGQVRNNHLYEQWLNEHTDKMKTLGETLIQIVKKLDEFAEDVNERLESDEYLQIVRKSFRVWDNADTFEKRELIRKLLTNAGTQKLVPDDLIRLFLDWLNLYHEVHFAVIKVVYQKPRSNKIWNLARIKWNFSKGRFYGSRFV
jgi:regulator of replication initiation timing